VTLPRQVLLGSTILITRRVEQRRFLLTPSATTRQVLLYCIHRAAQKYGIEIHAVQALSNHIHIVATDVHGELPKFMAWVDRESAKCLNEHYDRSEALWSSDHYSAVVLYDRESVIGKLVYLFVNCVQARLVRSYRDWPGLASGPRDWLQRCVTVKRPELHFAQKDPDWAEVQVRYTLPPALRDRAPEEVAAELDALIAEREREICTQAKREGKAFLGAERVCKQDPFVGPASKHTKGKLSPTFAAGTAAGQKRARQMLRHFRAAYREALHRWRGGEHSVVFPAGTYWLVRLCQVCCAALDTAISVLDSG
jgi:REP element-mobilizing transposase RayT